MNWNKKLIIMLGLGVAANAYSQDLTKIRPVLTGAPFLRIAPDARSGGMADQGVTTTPDTYSQYWNAAKYPFTNAKTSVGVSFTPYMNKITNDIFLLYGSFYTKLGEEDRSTLSASIYYFNMGTVDLSRIVGGVAVSEGQSKPNEFSIDLAYALKLSESFSMAVTGRYIRSDLSSLGQSSSTLQAANTFAVDIAGYYQSPKIQSFGEKEGRVRGGFAIQNVGPKLNYSKSIDSKSYLPTIARLGAGYDLFLDGENRLGLTLEASKLLVPGAEAVVDPVTNRVSYSYPDVSVINGMGKSFSNKKSVMYSIAADYSYNDTFDIRTGYFHESAEQGGRQFATIGVGLKYKSFGLDVSYLINTAKINNALDNTLRFGLVWDISE